MSRNYKFLNPEGVYFVSFAVVYWIDVFTRNEYKEIIVESLNFCIREKRMEIFAWCIMLNHIQLIFKSINEVKLKLNLKRVIQRHTIKSEEGQWLWDSRNIKEGTYIYELLEENKRIDSGKLTVVK